MSAIPMIGVLSCGARKLDRAAPAGELYISSLFTKSLAYARLHCDTIYVASAKYGLVQIDEVIEPYDTRIASSKLQRAAWAAPIVDALAARHGHAYYLLLAGMEYAQPIARGLKKSLGRDTFVADPLAGMQIGERLSFLTAQTRKAA